MTPNERRGLEKALHREGFGQGTAKRIVALVNRHFTCQEMANARSDERPLNPSSELKAEGGEPCKVLDPVQENRP